MGGGTQERLDFFYCKSRVIVKIICIMGKSAGFVAIRA